MNDKSLRPFQISLLFNFWASDHAGDGVSFRGYKFGSILFYNSETKASILWLAILGLSSILPIR